MDKKRRDGGKEGWCEQCVEFVLPIREARDEESKKACSCPGN